jgi:hypothetical protein
MPCVRNAIPLMLILEHRGQHVVVAEWGQRGVDAIEAYAFDACCQTKLEAPPVPEGRAGDGSPMGAPVLRRETAH